MDSVSVLSSIASQPMLPAAKSVPAESPASKRVESDSLTLPSAEQVDSLNKLLQIHQQHLSFSIDESSGVSVLRVIDSDSGDLIRQMPSESWLKLARELAASTTGLLRTHA
ncbi:MAG: flagellar protein FlaG [Pseudomonadota bacterium]